MPSTWYISLNGLLLLGACAFSKMSRTDESTACNTLLLSRSMVKQLSVGFPYAVLASVAAVCAALAWLGPTTASSSGFSATPNGIPFFVSDIAGWLHGHTRLSRTYFRTRLPHRAHGQAKRRGATCRGDSLLHFRCECLTTSLFSMQGCVPLWPVQDARASRLGFTRSLPMAQQTV